MTIQPLFDNILIEQSEAKKETDSGIILPNQATQEKINQGKVLAIGSDVKNVKVGDIVLFDKYIPNEIEVEKKSYLIIKEKDSLAIFLLA